MTTRHIGLFFLGFFLVTLTAFYLLNDGHAPASEHVVLFQSNSTKTSAGKALDDLCPVCCELLTKHLCRNF
jgi:hypothetical protein